MYLSLSFYAAFVLRRHNQLVLSDNVFRPNCFLDDRNQCQIYNCRPQSCQTYPNWHTVWESDESVLREAELCVGLRQAIDKILIK